MKQENNKIINNNSREYPMKTFYGNISPSNQKYKNPSIKLFPDLKHGYNNESPDFFRIDSIIENQTSYKNPYLNKVKTIDRDLYYKNNQTCIKHINLIDLVKSKRELSQNPKLLKKLNYSTDINILENTLHKEKSIVANKYKNLSSDFDNMDYLEKLKILNGEYLPNHHYLTKNSFDIKKINENQYRNSQGFTNINFKQNKNINDYDNDNVDYNFKDKDKYNDKDNDNDNQDKNIIYFKTSKNISNYQNNNPLSHSYSRINFHHRNFSQENNTFNIENLNLDFKNKSFRNTMFAFDKENIAKNININLNIKSNLNLDNIDKNKDKDLGLDREQLKKKNILRIRYPKNENEEENLCIKFIIYIYDKKIISNKFR
jgi:hypothetical protein